MSYSIVRFYADHREQRTLQMGLTLDDAQEHCQDPDTSSRTTTDPDAELGDWFDGYREEQPLAP